MTRTKQYADRVNVIKRVKVGGKWPFAPVVERNGRIVRDHVWVSRRDEHHPEGRYYIEWYQAGKRRRQAIGAFDQVLDAARTKSIELDAIKAGILVSNEQSSVPGSARLTLAAAIDQYLEYVKAQRSVRTYRTYRPTLDVLLRNSYTKTYVDEVIREDILRFMSDCFNLGLTSILYSVCILLIPLIAAVVLKAEFRAVGGSLIGLALSTMQVTRMASSLGRSAGGGGSFHSSGSLGQGSQGEWTTRQYAQPSQPPRATPEMSVSASRTSPRAVEGGA